MLLITCLFVHLVTEQPRAAVRGGTAVAHYPPGATFGPRTLRDFEFVWLLSGRARWAADGRTIDLQPGMLLLGRPGMTDQFGWAEEFPSTHAYVHFSVVDFGTLPSLAQWPLTSDLPPDGPLAGLCAYLLWLGRVPGTTDRIGDVVGWLLDLHVRGPLPPGEDTRDLPAQLQPLVEHVRERWRGGRTNALTMAELATGARLSPGQLCRVFRRRYGIGPVAAFERIRLTRAARLLLRSQLPVSAIADACGFANPYYFSRRFRLVYGVPPRTFRRGLAEADPLAPIAEHRLLQLAYAVLSL